MSIQRPKISIVIPVYNVEKYLSTCLNSCVHQTLFDIEIICVNDGSTDKSSDILEAFAKSDYRIKIVNKENGGLSSARNAGIDNASGEFIMFLDSDDYLALNACERVWTETLEAPTDVVVFGTHIFPQKPRAIDWYYYTLHVSTRRYFGFTPNVLFHEPGAKPFVWRQVFNRKLFDECHLRFDETVRYGEDTVFQMEAFPHLRNFSFISDRLYCYRWYREGSLMHTYQSSLDDKIRVHLSLVEKITQYWKNQGWLEKYGKDFVQWQLEFIVPDVRNSEVECAAEHLTELKRILKQFSLESYLHSMPRTVKSLVNTLNKGRV